MLSALLHVGTAENLTVVHINRCLGHNRMAARFNQTVEALSIPMEKRDSLLLATLDVKALYPSIPQGIGVTFALQQAIIKVEFYFLYFPSRDF